MPRTDIEARDEGEAALPAPNVAQHGNRAPLEPNTKNEYGANALVMALGNNDLELVKSLLGESIPKDRRNTYLTARNPGSRCAALHYAACLPTTGCEYDLIGLLLGNSADKNECVTATDDWDRTALHLATHDVEVARRLINEATDKIGYINAKDIEGKTALHYAAHEERIDAMRLLIALSGNSNDYINVQTASGETPLHTAVHNQDAGAVSFLLSQGANNRLRNISGYSAWDIACFPVIEEWDIIAVFILAELDGKNNPPDVLLTRLIESPPYTPRERTTGNNMLTVYHSLFQIVYRFLDREYMSHSTEVRGEPSYPQVVKAFSGLLRQVRRDFHENQEALPHLRSREPSCTVQTLNYSGSVNSGSKRFVSLVIPFIDVKSWSIIEEREADYESNKPKYCISDTRKFVEYHTPTTLDEYCNPALSKGALSLRNKTQVLKRYEEFIRRKNNDTQADNDVAQTSFSDDNQDDLTFLGELKILLRSYMKPQQATKTKAEEDLPPENVVLVRQSWIWIIDDNIIKTQPLDWGQYHFGVSSFQQRDRSPTETVALFLSRLIEQFDSPARGGEGSLLKIYENALLFISEEVNEYTKSALVEDIDLNRENALFHKINDFREELSMIRSVLAEQEEVWNEFMNLMWPNQGPDHQLDYHLNAEDTENLVSESAEKRSDKANQRMRESERFRQLWRPRAKFNKYKRRIEKLEQDAERVERNILTKLDLKQKHAAITEAHSTAVLSATVFGFTIITVIFAPLSFVIALFALPIDMFNEGKNGDKDGVYSYHYIGKWSAATELVSIFVTLLAMWAALRFTGLHVWGKKGLRESIRQKAKDIRMAERKAEEASKKKVKSKLKRKVRTSDVEKGMSTTS